MKIGYVGLNTSIGCRANARFRLKSYSEELLIEKVTNNLDCLRKILEFNVKHDLKFFRITSDLVPFASHPVCKFDYVRHFRERFDDIGSYIREHDIRISMHPDQFVVINSQDAAIVNRSIDELEYHRKVLDAMGIDGKIQIHVGGVYGDKDAAIARFIKNYKSLPDYIKKRLVIENDDRLFSLRDCLLINRSIGIPIVFDSFHHGINNNGETLLEAIRLAQKTWQESLMVDYSSQEPGARTGTHASTIDISDFREFIRATEGEEFDIMLEIKDKEKSAIKARGVI